jgi:tetratricopeptide (TPR) repeat protein
LYESIGGWSAAETIERQRLETTRRVGDRRAESDALLALSRLLWQLGRLDESEEASREAEKIGRWLGDQRVIAGAIGNRGLVHANRGEYAEALACYVESESIARQLSDRNGTYRAVGNVGMVHYDRGEYAKALECYAESESIARELGDRHGVLRAFGNRGNVHADRGEYSKALACYAEQESIARDLGHRRGIANAIGNRGLVHSYRGEYPEALICLHQAVEEHRDIGFRFGLSIWLWGTAGTLLEILETAWGDTPDIPPFLRQYVPEAEPTTWGMAALRAARKHAQECVEISGELSKPSTLFEGRVLLARITAAEGNAEAAIGRLYALYKSAGNDEQRADLHYWLWKLGALEDDHYAQALRLYRSLYASVPKHEYQLRIDELELATKSTTPEADDGTA